MADPTSTTTEPPRLTADSARKQIGYSGLKTAGGYLFQEYDPDLRMPRAAKIFDEMRRSDPTIAAGLRAICWTLGQVQWTVEPGGTTAADREAAGFLDSCRDDASITWRQIVSDILTCLWAGFAWQELVYKQRRGPDGDPPSRYDDGRLGWDKFVLVHPESLLRWQFDDARNVLALEQLAIWAGPEYQGVRVIPMNKSLLFRLEPEFGNPEGISLLRPIYLSWYAMRQIKEVEAIGIERDLTGVLVIHLPVGATQTDHDKAVNLLEQYKADDMAGFTAPQFGPGEHERWRFEVINSPGNKTIDTDSIIKRYQHDIARSFLTQFLMLGEAAGSRATSQDQTDFFETALKAILQMVEETFNRTAVPALFRYNDFGTLTALPQLKAGRISKAESAKFANAMNQLTTAGLITPDIQLEEYLRSEFDLPARPDDPAPTEQQMQPGKPSEDTGAQERRGKQASEPEPDELDHADPYDDDAEKRIDELLKELEKDVKRGRGMAELLSFAGPSKFQLQQLLDSASSRLERQMATLAEQYRTGAISYDRWASAGKSAIQDNVLVAQKIGLAEARGVYPPSRLQLTSTERLAGNKLVDEQLRYFSSFRADVRAQVADGKELTTALDARAKMYKGGVKAASSSARVSDKPNVNLRWERHATDSCDTCIGLDGQVKTAQEWHAGGILPAVGTICRGNCQCSLVPA